MVPFFGFFELSAVGVELVFGVKRQAVNTGEHGVALIAAPVGTGNVIELEAIGSNFFGGVVTMATTTEVGKLSFRASTGSVERDRLTLGGNLVD